ncbi:MAG: Swarming motility protein SwrC [Paenibacillaceae bacterium]|nr:Swarming motility protein SwrC [Paenibacillaceae bacterium]
MRSVIRFSVNNKFALWILTVIVVITGLYSGMNMKAETIPNIEVPIMTVVTVYPGAAPQDVLEKATEPLEQRLRSLDGVNIVSSTSAENYSAIILEYNYSKDMDEAEAEAKEALSSMTLSSGVQDPTVSRLSLNAFPVISLSITDEGKSPAELTELLQSAITPAFKRVGGVATVEVSGQQVQEVQIRPNADKIKALGLSVETVTGIIQGSAVTFPLGVFEMDNTEKVLLLDGNLSTLEDLQKTALPLIPTAGAGMGAGANMGAGPGTGADAGAASQGQPAANPVQQTAAGAQAAMPGLPTVTLGEVADVTVVDQNDSISRTNGKPAIGVNIVKSPDANTVDVVNGIKDEVKLLQEQYDGLNVAVTLDQGKPIEQSISTMLSKAAFGALFAVVIIMLFLRNIRSTIISIISIPLSLLIAILLLRQMDITLNMMTLGAMTVAIGRVVDDSIVVIENIFRRMTLSTEKLRGRELIIEATKEMFIPIFSSTIVTIAVFLPLALVTGPIGELFMDFALTMVFALLASLLVAVTIVPMTAHSLLKKGVGAKSHDEHNPGRLSNAYKRVLGWSLNHKALTFFGALAVLVLSVVILVPAIGVSFLPAQEEKTMTITYTPDPSERKQDVEAMALKAEGLLLKKDGVEIVQYSVGASGNPLAMSSSTKSALFMLKYEDDFSGFEDEKERVMEELQGLAAPGLFKQQDISSMMGGGNKLSLYVFGDELPKIEGAVNQITEKMKASDSFANVDTSLSKSYDQYKLVADQAKLARLGLTAGQIGMELMPVRERPVLTTIEKDGQDLNVYVEVDKASPSTKAELENKVITSPLGIPVALKDVVTIEEGKSPNTLARRNTELYAEITADITGKDVSKANGELDDAIEALNLPPELHVEYGGVTEQINESFTQLGMAMAAAIAIVYFILVVTFGGALAPFAILFSLPFTIIGGLVALFLAGETLSVSAMIGALMLIGIVVTNAIVLIDRVLKKEKEGMPTREALMEAAATRLRPILMTALATIGALLPLALGFEGSDAMISKGLGVTVIGGLASSTVLTLLIVPVVYEFLRKFSGKKPIED